MDEVLSEADGDCDVDDTSNSDEMDEMGDENDSDDMDDSEDMNDSDDVNHSNGSSQDDIETFVRYHERHYQTRIGTGRVIPEKFTPPKETDMPQQVFPHCIGENTSPWVHRFIRRTTPAEVLIYTDGACVDNGSKNPKGGCAFVYRPSNGDVAGYTSFRLEDKGPTGE